MYPRKGTLAPGVDTDVVIFDPNCLRAITAHLVDDLGAMALCVGTDFALGRGRAGNIAALRALGVEVVAAPLETDASGAKVSSLRLRAARGAHCAGRVAVRPARDGGRV